MSKVLALFLIVALGIVGCTNQSPRDPIETLSSPRFVVHFPRGHRNAAAEVLRELDASYERIVTNLKPDRTGVFTVRLYASVQEFHTAINRPGLPDWVVGTAWGDSEIRMVSPKNPGPIHTYQGMIAVAVHELAHCVTMRIGNVPPQRIVWLWESIALYAARQFRNPRGIDYMVTGNYPRFLSATNQIQKPEIYAIGYTVMEYLVKSHGWDAVRQLVVTNGDVKDVLNMSEDEFYEAWYGFVKAKYLN